MKTVKVRRLLRGFDKRTERLRAEIDISEIPLSELQVIFGNPPTDLMYESQSVTDDLREKLSDRLGKGRIRGDLDWFIEAEAE